MKIRHFLIIIIGVAIFFAVANAFVYSQEVEKKEPTKVESTELVQCSNPAGCVGELELDQPACPVCGVPSSSVVVSQHRSGDISKDIIALKKQSYLLEEEINKIEKEREEEYQRKLAEAKIFDAVYAQKVYEKERKFVEAKQRTLDFIKRGGERVEGSWISGYIGGKPAWKKEAYFIVRPRPRGSVSIPPR